MNKRKNKGSFGATIEKVFRTYGHDVAEESSSLASVAVGRKQRRREAKVQKKKNKMKNNFKSSKTTPSETTMVASPEVEEKDVKKVHAKKRPKKSAEAVRKAGLKHANQEENKVISALEKKLYMNKRKGKKKLPKSFVDAGLDYILDVVEGRGCSDEELNDDSKDAFFSEMNYQEVQKDVEEKGKMEEEEKLKEEEKQEGEEKQEDVGGCESNIQDNEDIFSDEDSHEDDEGTDDKRCQEESSNILSSSGEKYIPPAMRVKLSDEQEENMRKLKRRLKGLLNRLSDANISKICSDIEAMYRESSRAIMHKVLTDAILDQFCTRDSISESLISENAILIAILSSLVGIESLIHFYEVLTLKLNKLIRDKDAADGKASNNLLQLLGYLYQFKSIDCKVILDIFRLLIESFTEKDIELILEILNTAGFQLRKDDPEALRDIIKTISTKCEEAMPSINDRSRLSYMMNILTAVKNNNIRKVTGFDPEKLTLRRKKLAALVKNSERNCSANTVPPVTLQDFLNIETNGRWWIVGSSFTGRPVLRKQDEAQGEKPEYVDADESVSKKVAEAARSQRMNTDVRRKIFYAVMTADDFVDAFEKVMKCGLKGKQLREIATVIVDCAQQEKSFNAYYLHLLNRFCQHDRQFAISIQCTIWDRFKVLESMKQNQMENIAKLLSQLIIVESLSLNCLKAIEFTEIDKTMIQFLRLFLCTLAAESSGVDHLRTIFDPLRISPKTKVVRQGLRLFLQYFMLSDEKFMAEHLELQGHFQAMLSSVGKAKSTFL